MAAYGQQARQARARVQLRPARHGGRAAGRDRHPVADLLDDQADHLGSGDDPLRGGGVRADRPGERAHPGVRRRPGVHGGSDLRPVTVPAVEPVRIWHLLTHTAGLTYGFLRAHPVDARYREAGFEWGQPRGMDLAECCDAWAGQPLLFQPGTEWNYSVATDVLGRVVEVA